MKIDPNKLKANLESRKREPLEFIHGDSAKVLQRLESNSIDLVVTSPPYDALRDYKGYVFDFETIAKQLARVLRPGGVIVWIVGDATIDGSETGSSFRQALYFKDECGMNLHDTMIWNKGSSPYPQNSRYYSVFEYMFVFSKGGPATANLLRDRVNITAGKEIRAVSFRDVDGVIKPMKVNNAGSVFGDVGCRVNVWNIPPNTLSDLGHPATYPVQLAIDHILSWSNPGDLVLDPFLGSGTTGEAAIKTNRRFVGIEISVDYLKIARRRIDKLYALKV